MSVLFQWSHTDYGAFFCVIFKLQGRRSLGLLHQNKRSQTDYKSLVRIELRKKLEICPQIFEKVTVLPLALRLLCNQKFYYRFELSVSSDTHLSSFPGTLFQHCTLTSSCIPPMRMQYQNSL